MLRLALSLVALASPGGAECRLALSLAVDVSRSIDSGDYVIQTEGLARALEDDDVRSAIFGPEGLVALSIYYWSGDGYQHVVQPWVILDTPRALDTAIWQLRLTPRPKAPLATAIGDALRFGAGLMGEAPDCARRVIDVAGDGRNNEGLSVARTYERVDFTGITVNGLAIGEHEIDLVRYFHDELIRGPGAFVEVAPRQTDYPEAIRRKLLRELQGPMIGALHGSDPGQS